MRKFYLQMLEQKLHGIYVFDQYIKKVNVKGEVYYCFVEVGTTR